MAKPRDGYGWGETVSDLLPDFLRSGDPYAVIAREIAPQLSDLDFADCYGVRGPTPESPKRLALITLFQFMEKLPDRQAARMVKMRLDWKIALGLPLGHEGFHFCILSEFRERLVVSEQAGIVFNGVLRRLQELGLVKARGKQRLDATHVVGCVRVLSRLELVTESLRVAVEALEKRVGNEAVLERLGEELVEFAGTRPDLRKLNEKQRRRKLTEAGRHAVAFLEAVDRWERGDKVELEAIRILREVVKQQFRVSEEKVALPLETTAWQETPGPERISTPHDPEARYGQKRKKGWVGYKVEIVETAEAHAPNFITEIQVQNAAEPDQEALEPMVEALADRGILPGTLYVDQGYTGAEKIAMLQSRHGVDVRGSVVEEPDRGVFPQSAFQIDEEARRATCPNGKQSVRWVREENGDSQIQFAESDCAACPLRPQCTKGKGSRHLTVNAHSEILRRRRQEQKEPAFIREMHNRNAIEGTVSELKRGHGLARCRYRGTLKFQLQAWFSAAAGNVKRLARAVSLGRVVLPMSAR